VELSAYRGTTRERRLQGAALFTTIAAASAVVAGLVPTVATSAAPPTGPPEAAAVARVAEALPPLKSPAELSTRSVRLPANDAPRALAAKTLHPAPQQARGVREGGEDVRGAASAHPIVTVRRGSVALLERPAGREVGRIGGRTEFGSASVLSVVSRRGPWLGVTSPERPNGRLAWIDGRARGLGRSGTHFSLHADLSRRTLELRRGGRVVKRMSVAIGRPGSSTPTGRFAVTDKLDGSDYSSYFGCCILALSGIQPNLPAGWPGGNRLAIHGTSSPQTIGQAVSAGCLRAGEDSVRDLMRRVPVGTPVFIGA